MPGTAIRIGSVKQGLLTPDWCDVLRSGIFYDLRVEPFEGWFDTGPPPECCSGFASGGAEIDNADGLTHSVGLQ